MNMQEIDALMDDPDFVKFIKNSDESLNELKELNRYICSNYLPKDVLDAHSAYNETSLKIKEAKVLADENLSTDFSNTFNNFTNDWDKFITDKKNGLSRLFSKDAFETFSESKSNNEMQDALLDDYNSEGGHPPQWNNQGTTPDWIFDSNTDEHEQYNPTKNLTAFVPPSSKHDVSRKFTSYDNVFGEFDLDNSVPSKAKSDNIYATDAFEKSVYDTELNKLEPDIPNTSDKLPKDESAKSKLEPNNQNFVDIFKDYDIENKSPIKHAIGNDYVPYDGYLAELHKGEAVLSKTDADDWRSKPQPSTYSTSFNMPAKTVYGVSQYNPSQSRPTVQQKHQNDLLDKELRIIQDRKELIREEEYLIIRKSDQIKAQERLTHKGELPESSGQSKQSFFESLFGGSGLLGRMFEGFSGSAATTSSSYGSSSNKISSTQSQPDSAEVRRNADYGHSDAANVSPHPDSAEAKAQAAYGHSGGSKALDIPYEIDENANITDFGKVSRQFENGSPKGDAGTVAKDNVGWAYGAYQFNSKVGSLNTFLNDTKYGAMFEGLTPETQEFNDRWKSIADNDTNFGKAQHEFAKKQHFDVLNNRVSEALGTDISQKGRAVQEMLFSTSIQYGAYTDVINNALKGKDINSLSEKDIVNLVQDYKYDNAHSLFTRNNGKDAEAQRKNRIPQEKEALLALCDAADMLFKDDEAKPKNIPKLAIGHDYIPYDGYRAELHKGEAVLSKSLAEKWRSGREGIDILPIKRLLENLPSPTISSADKIRSMDSSIPFQMLNDITGNTSMSTTSTQNVNINVGGKILGMDKDNQVIVSSALKQYYSPDSASSNKRIMSMLEHDSTRRQR